jgi:nucleotide-binding universal stress UspA family protein
VSNFLSLARNRTATSRAMWARPLPSLGEEAEMIAMERILVAHDFTRNAAAALDTAVTLAGFLGARCEVLHVIERAGTDAGGEPPAGFAVEYRQGLPHEEIVRCARERGIDLIVMGTHGRRGVVHALLGSVAEKVVRNAPCPVLTVRERSGDAVAANILVATDFGPASELALEYGRTLAHLFGATLHLLHVAENYFMRPIASDPHALMASAREQLHAQLTHDDRKALSALAVLDLSDNTAAAIVDYAKNANVDLIVMGTHGRQAFDRFLVGSVAEHVVRSAPCHVLTVRQAARHVDAPHGDDRYAEEAGVSRNSR